MLFSPKYHTKKSDKPKLNIAYMRPHETVNGTLTVIYDTNQDRLSMCEACSATLGRNLSTSNLGCLHLTRLVLWGSLSRSSPPVSLSPLKAAGALTPALWPSKRGFLSAPLAVQGTSPLLPPTSNIPFSGRDNFIHLVHHCIQLNAESMRTLECIERACVRVFGQERGGEALCLNFCILTENHPHPFLLHRAWGSNLRKLIIK